MSALSSGTAQSLAYAYDAHDTMKTITDGVTPANSQILGYDMPNRLDAAQGGYLEERTSTGAAVTRQDTVYLEGVPLADISAETGAISYLHTDRLGTPQVATTSTGAIAWRGAYAPFGAVTAPAGLLTQNLRFPGQYADVRTGYYQNGFRDYNPAIGRYLESDPIGLLGGPNTFAYVADNPDAAGDPFGLSTLVYNNRTNTLTLNRNDGSSTDYPAYNNTDSTSGGPIPAGTYDYDGHQVHPNDGPESAYGSNGGYKFDVPGRTNIEVHSGRRSKPDRRGRIGPEHATFGCIRTDDEGTSGVQQQIEANDPPTSLTVIR